MPNENDHAAEERLMDELGRMLRVYEGPPTPQVRQSAVLTERSLRTPRRRLLAALALAGALSAVAAATLVALGSEGQDARVLRGGEVSESQGSCIGELDFNGIQYVPTATHDLAFRADASLGKGVIRGCVGNLRVDESGETTASTIPDEVVIVQAIAGVDQDVAVIRSDTPGMIYLAPGRCVVAANRFERCVREPLVFGGEEYVESSVHLPIKRGSVLGEGTRAACCGEEAETLAVTSLEGVSPDVAVAHPSEERILYIAAGKCLVQSPTAFLRCLRASS